MKFFKILFSMSLLTLFVLNVFVTGEFINVVNRFVICLLAFYILDPAGMRKKSI